MIIINKKKKANTSKKQIFVVNTKLGYRTQFNPIILHKIHKNAKIHFNNLIYLFSNIINFGVKNCTKYTFDFE